MKGSHALAMNLAPRGLSRQVAAEYIGVSVGKFDAMVADQRMPPAKRIDGRKVWDRDAVDKAFYALPDDGETYEASSSNPWDGAQ